MAAVRGQQVNTYERTVIISALMALAVSSVVGFVLILAVGGIRSPNATIALIVTAGIFLVLWFAILLLQWIRNPAAVKPADDPILPIAAVNSVVAGRTQGDATVLSTPPIRGGDLGCRED
jgi:hypothetical protein